AGKKLRLRGQGLPRDDGTRGDLYAVLLVQVPLQVDEPEKKLWEEISRRSRWQPRGRV
ncbi:MAG: molecular chaperone DnaJ, partial [Verrucomicrobia bacterium]|nr:molecular chaperone DnaJ [Verrucomicrobiota bacterium]